MPTAKLETVNIPLTLPETAMCLYIAIEKYIMHDLTKTAFLSLFVVFSEFTEHNYGVMLHKEAVAFVDRIINREDLRKSIAIGFDSEFAKDGCMHFLNNASALRNFECLVDTITRNNLTFYHHPLKFKKLSKDALLQFQSNS